MTYPISNFNNLCRILPTAPGKLIYGTHGGQPHKKIIDFVTSFELFL